MRKTTTAIVALLVVTLATGSYAVNTQIGDVDGFGWGVAVGKVGADGNPAERNSTGLLDSGDVLPDINTNGSVATGSGDDWDNRSAAEAADAYARWTDVTLSTSFAGRPGLPDDASFVFTFAVPTAGDADYEMDHFVSLVYGDYDVIPMTAVVEGVSVPLLGNRDGGVDGYIWRAYAPVAWADMLDGVVTIDIEASNEPYVTFDYALLDLEPIDVIIPAPGAALLAGIGVGFVTRFRRRRAR